MRYHPDIITSMELDALLKTRSYRVTQIEATYLLKYRARIPEDHVSEQGVASAISMLPQHQCRNARERAWTSVTVPETPFAFRAAAQRSSSHMGYRLVSLDTWLR